MFRIYFYLFVSINFLALTCLFIVSFVNIIFIREEFIEIPINYSARSYEDGKKIKFTDGFKYIYAIVKYNFSSNK